MQIYLPCSNCNKKILLNSPARTRGELASIWGDHFHIACPHCNYQGLYSVTHVYAEVRDKSAAAGAIIGGLIGLLLGPEGALIGSAIGGAGGFAKDEEEKKKVQRFNESYL